jgi:hypothetical protein
VSELTPGPDHAAPEQPAYVAFFATLASLRKALVAFLVGGGGAAVAQQFTTFDFMSWSWTDLWRGLIVGALSGIVVYFTRNSSPPGVEV